MTIRTTQQTHYEIAPVDPVEDAQRRALEIANDFRKRIGEKQISGIVPGINGDGAECVLARTFNASCNVGYEQVSGSVRYDDETGDEIGGVAQYGWASFYEAREADAFMQAVNAHLNEDEEPATVKRDAGGVGHGRTWKVSLPVAIAQIAVDFDNRALAEEFYESHYKALYNHHTVEDVLAGLTEDAAA